MQIENSLQDCCVNELQAQRTEEAILPVSYLDSPSMQSRLNNFVDDVCYSVLFLSCSLYCCSSAIEITS